MTGVSGPGGLRWQDVLEPSSDLARALRAMVLSDLQDPDSAIAEALKAALVVPLPTVGSLTYSNGLPTADADGNTYTWNTDGTPATQTKGGVTRIFHWNTDGTLASVS